MPEPVKYKASELDALEAKLTHKQRQLVVNVGLMGMSGADAAREAGYNGTNHTVIASKTLAKPHVAEYLQALLMSQLSARGGTALHVIDRLMNTARSEYVQLEAAKDMANRAGWQPPERKQVTVQGDVSAKIELD